MVDKDKEQGLIDLLGRFKSSEGITAMKELLLLRRKRHRDALERGDDIEARGRAKECKKLLDLLS